MLRDSEHVEHQEPKSAEAVKPPALPKISYNRGALQEVVGVLIQKLHAVKEPETKKAEEVSAHKKPEATKAEKVSERIDKIEKKISEIKEYQEMENPEAFYQLIKTALLEIRNAANEIYKLAKSCDQTLSNTLKQLILGWIKPLEDALRRLEMPVPARAELELKTKYLYAGQSFVSRQPALQQSLMQHLEKLKQLFVKPGEAAPRCYISYAWPSPENAEQEYWIQPFLYVLYDHLKAAGITVVMDIRDNRPGENIYQFMKQYHDGNYIILVGTESLLQKHEGVVPHAVQTELSIVSSRTEKDQKQFGQSRIYPMLISGTLTTAYPDRYQLYSTVRDTRDKGYLETLKKLTDWIYENPLEQDDEQYANLWTQFFRSMPALSKNIDAIVQELAYGYHKQRLDNLRQDIPIQAVRNEPLVVQSSPAPESRDASSFVTPAVQRVQGPVVVSESLSSSNHHPMTQSASQPRVEEGGSGLLPRAPSNGAHTQRTYCPYFSRTALISFSVLAVGVALETGRRYYFKP